MPLGVCGYTHGLMCVLEGNFRCGVLLTNAVHLLSGSCLPWSSPLAGVAGPWAVSASPRPGLQVCSIMLSTFIRVLRTKLMLSK